MTALVLTREERGKMIADKPDQIIREDERFYMVASQSGHGMYRVVKARMNRTIGWVCDCPDFTYRQVKCKHVWAVEFSNALRNKVKKNVVIQPISPNVCPYCTSTTIIRHGVRHNVNGDLQRFTCRTCGKRFTQNLGFEKLKATPEVVTSAMQLYFTGESLRNVQKFLKLRGVEVSHQTVYNWIKKYVGLMKHYLAQMQPQVGDTWRADELFLKVHGDLKYLYALMDDETRFWIAQEVADTKYTADVSPLFRQGKVVAGKVPHTVITDGAFNFNSAIRTAYWREHRALMIKHIRDIRFGGEIHNNKMERMNGEIRDREKVVRGVKKPDSPLLQGYQLYHNFVRPHMALEGQTPADRAGIKIEGQDKWMTIIQNASKKNQSDNSNDKLSSAG
jgi:transposase-like protein